MPANPATVDRFLEAFNSREPERLRSVLASDFVFEDAAGPGAPSLQALVEEARLIVSAFPDIQYLPVRKTDEGNRTYVEFKAVGTHRGEFLGVPPTGTTAFVSGVFNLQGNDEVTRLKLTVDFGGLRRQLLVAARAAAGSGGME